MSNATQQTGDGTGAGFWGPGSPSLSCFHHLQSCPLREQGYIQAIQPQRACNLTISSIFTAMRSHDHSQLGNTFTDSKRNPFAVTSLPPTPSSPGNHQPPFCPCKCTCSEHFIRMESSDRWSFVTGFFQSAYLQAPFVLKQVLGFRSLS